MEAQSSKTAQHIAKFGWAVTMVPEDAEGPAFAYTTGLWASFWHPELFIQGLPLNVMHAVLNSAVERVRGGERLQASSKLDDLLQHFSCGIRIFQRAKHRECLGEAVRYYGGKDFDALQILWPDDENRLPGDAGCNESIQRIQEPTLS